MAGYDHAGTEEGVEIFGAAVGASNTARI
jgi:hypothetical protein